MKTSNNVCVVAGSFDPIHNGHIWLINKASSVFSEVIVMVSDNHEKKYLLDSEERAFLASKCVPNKIEVLPSKKLLAPYCQGRSIFHQVRGIRTLEDYGYELKCHEVNKLLAPTLETVVFFSPSELSNVSSSLLKAMVKHAPDVAERFAPKEVLDVLKERV